MAPSRDAEDISLLAILVEMGLLTPQDKETIEFLFAEHEGKPTLDMMVGAYLVNGGHVKVEDLELAEIHQESLQSEDLLVQTRARVAMAKKAAAQIRERIRKNTILSEAILKDGDRIRKKSTSSEHVAIGFLTAKKLEK